MQILERWKCGECGEIHDDENDARECCLPGVFEVYQCPICKTSHIDSQEAEECLTACKEQNPQFRYMASIKELEDQGQQRLFN